MNRFASILFLFVVCLFVQSCGTAYLTRKVDIEVTKPAIISIPQKYRSVAVMLNNVNVMDSCIYNNYGVLKKDDGFVDSLASKVCLQSVSDFLRKQHFFDTIMFVPDKNYANAIIIDTSDYQNHTSDSVYYSSLTMSQRNAMKAAFLFDEFKLDTNHNDTLFLHPETGLLSPEVLSEISDLTNADLLLSLDYFSSVAEYLFLKSSNSSRANVKTNTIWSIYDLKTKEYLNVINFVDDASWGKGAHSIREAQRLLPSRKDAVCNAADVAGENFVYELVPHWVKESRFYYVLNWKYLDIQAANKYAKENNWLKAASIWKKYVDSKNKNIAAQCMYNMAIVCEMQGNVDAAIEWAVKSFYVYENQNPNHASLCKDYIHQLSERKSDIHVLDKQFAD
jgi:hypothetical protein